MSLSTLPGDWDPVAGGFLTPPGGWEPPSLGQPSAAVRARFLLHEASRSLALEQVLASSAAERGRACLRQWHEAMWQMDPQRDRRGHLSFAAPTAPRVRAGGKVR